MQISILSGIYTNEDSDFRIAYPRNLVPVPIEQGISQGYLKPAEGIVTLATGPGKDRGGINWRGTCYRVMGTKLVTVSSAGTIIEIGTIAGTDWCSFDYSSDYLSIAGGGNLYLYNGTLTQVTDADLGTVVHHIWVDGYFMTTDGTFLVVTELNDPFSVLTTKYGSSESDPDPIKAVLKLHNEPTAINRYTMETFSNIGGTNFPFQRVDGALISKGSVGTHTCCLFADNIAFMGSGRNEGISVYLGSNGVVVRIATSEIDRVLATYSESQLADAITEARVDKGHNLLYIHLPDQTLVYDYATSQLIEQSVWFILDASHRGLVWCNDKWTVGDPDSSNIGYLTTEVSTQWGARVAWEFSTRIFYNDGNGAIFHELELVCLSGRCAIGKDPMVSTSYSLDGETWSQERYIRAGKNGERTKRLVWLQQGPMRHWRIQRFRGDSDTRLSIARLEAQVEGLL